MRQRIGAVLASLTAEFPDISISKIRFLEAQGLINPARTASGYRVYSDEDISRLRFILAAQRDRFWPLKVIAEHLDAMDRGLVPAGEAPGDLHAPEVARSPLPDFRPQSSQIRLTGGELAQACQLDEETLGELIDNGLLIADADGFYSEAAAALGSAVARLLPHGIGPRHLRASRTAVDRELGLVEAALGPRADSSELAELASAMATVHAALMTMRQAK